MRILTLLAAVLVVACSQSTPAASIPARTQTASQPRLETPSAPESPAPADLPVSQVGFSCRLAVSVQTADGKRQGGFLSLPSGTLTMDPAGKGGLYFDRTFSKWVPQPRNSISPDGTRYAYGSQTADGQPLLHVVSVATGADRVYILPKDMYDAIGGIYVVDFQVTTVYMGIFVEGGLVGIWALNLSSGQTARLNGPEDPLVMDGNVVWGTSFNQADHNPLTFPPGFRANQVDAYDMSTGRTTTWLYRPGNLVGVLAVDAAHHPIASVLIDKDTAELLLLIDPNTQRTIFKGSTSSWIGYIDSIGGGVISDSHGTWFGTAKGLYLYSPATGVLEVSDMQSMRPANGCF